MLTNTIHFHFKHVSHQLDNYTDEVDATASCYAQNNGDEVCRF